MTWSDWSPRTTATEVGAVGGPIGVTAGEGNDGADWLIALSAITVNVYEVPLVSPVIVHVVALVVEQVSEPGVDVTLYPVTVDPFPDDALQVIVA